MTFRPLSLRWWRSRAEDVAALLLLSMAVSFLIQIIWRYVLNQPQGWTVEYVAISWLWGILFGYAFIVDDKDVVRLDIIYSKLSKTKQAWADIVSGVTVLSVLCVALVPTIEFVLFMGIERTAFLQIGFDWVFSIFVPFMLVVIYRLVRQIKAAVFQITVNGDSQ